MSNQIDSYRAIADSLPSICSRTKLAKNYDIPLMCINNWLSGKHAPSKKRKEAWAAIQRDWCYSFDRDKWIKR